MNKEQNGLTCKEFQSTLQQLEDSYKSCLPKDVLKKNPHLSQLKTCVASHKKLLQDIKHREKYLIDSINSHGQMSLKQHGVITELPNQEHVERREVTELKKKVLDLLVYVKIQDLINKCEVHLHNNTELLFGCDSDYLEPEDRNLTIEDRKKKAIKALQEYHAVLKRRLEKYIVENNSFITKDKKNQQAQEAYKFDDFYKHYADMLSAYIQKYRNLLISLR